jgi:hypothetical protein
MSRPRPDLDERHLCSRQCRPQALPLLRRQIERSIGGVQLPVMVPTAGQQPRKLAQICATFHRATAGDGSHRRSGPVSLQRFAGCGQQRPRFCGDTPPFLGAYRQQSWRSGWPLRPPLFFAHIRKYGRRPHPRSLTHPDAFRQRRRRPWIGRQKRHFARSALSYGLLDVFDIHSTGQAAAAKQGHLAAAGFASSAPPHG